MKAPIPSPRGSHDPEKQAMSFVKGRDKNRRAGRRYPKLLRRLQIPKSRRLRPGMKIRLKDGVMYWVDRHGAIRRGLAASGKLGVSPKAATTK